MTSLPILRDAHAYCFFFDFDGTLTEIAETPGGVHLANETRAALQALHDAASGAVAIVTGREIEIIDRYLAPLKLPTAGVHGFERRDASGATLESQANGRSAALLFDALNPFVERNPGLLLEKKRGALALHYRKREELEQDCISIVEAEIARLDDAVLTRGKMVIEVRFHRATKGTAIGDFLAETPFKGRVPVFAGDDVTDEDGFEVVNRCGGLSIKVGPGKTAALARAGTVGEFLAWLTEAAEAAKRAQKNG